MSDRAERSIVLLGAVAGLAGVVLSALAAHITGGGSLDVAARFLLAHAPVLIGIAVLLALDLVGRRLGLVAAGAMTLGLVLFCGDLAVRALAGVALVPMAAPTGGFVLMAGWIALGLAAMLRRRD